MARLKFLPFALGVLGLWLAHLALISPALYGRAVQLASAQAQAAPQAALARVHQQRLQLQGLALRAATSAKVAAVVAHPRAEAPNAERLNALVAAVTAGARESLQRVLVVGWINDAGALFSRGGQGVPADSGLDAAALAQAGDDGVVRQAFGSAHLFYSLPVRGSSSAAESKPSGWVVLGAPVVEEGMLPEAAREAAASLVLVQSGRVVAAAGPDSASAELAERRAQLGRSLVLVRGELQSVGPFKFPLLTQPGDWLGGAAPLALASRQAAGEGVPLEVVSVVSLKPVASWLASYQKRALAVFAGLVALSVVWLVLLGHWEPDEPAPSISFPKPPEPAARTPAFVSSLGPKPATEPVPPLRPAPPAAENGFESQRSEDESALPFSNAPEPAPPPIPDDYDFDHQETRAYPIQPGAEPGPGPDPSPPAPPLDDDYNSDATRVAMIPDELLRASVRPGADPLDGRLMPPPPPEINPEEQHIQDVYREFLATRERLGESGEGITYDRFAQKLQKNRDQLIQKYACKSVRFQVYVKDGKAALKATPLKE